MVHLKQYGGFGQLRFRCTASPQFQQIGPNLSIDAEVEDDAVGVCLTPCLFVLLELVLREDGEPVLLAG